MLPTNTKWISIMVVLTVLFIFATLQTDQNMNQKQLVMSKGEVQPTYEQHSMKYMDSSSEPQPVKVLTASERIQKYKDDPLPDKQFREHYKAVTVVATGYSAGVESTGKKPGEPEYGITFSGVKVRRDAYSTIAADPSVFPLGTILYIPGYGYGVVADTGSAIKGHKIDLFFTSKERVYREWGKQKLNVYLIKKGSGKVTETMLNQLNHSVSVVSKTAS